MGGARTSRFVGRVEELATFDRLLRSLPEEGAATVLVAGEAGMGKSRLVAELRQRAGAAGALVATGRTPVEGANLPYGTIVGMLRELGRKVGPRETADLLEPVQQRLLGDVSEPGPLARVQLFEALLRAVEGLAADRPLTLVLEDLHWADAGSVEILDHLVRNLDAQPVLVAATYRPDELDQRPPVRRVLTEMRRHPAVHPVALDGLSREEIAALLADVAGEAQPWTVVDAVHRRSEGNPLFAEELIDVRDAGGLPPALHDLLALRVGELSPDARAAVAAAAVLGTGCDHRLLASVAELDGPALDDALAEAVRRGVLVTDGSTGTVRFRHALLQEAAHAALLPAERVRLHRRAAGALVDDPSLAAAGPGAASAELAEHRFEAGDWAAACEASLAAARAAGALYSVHAAWAHLRRAVDAHRLAAGTCIHDGVDDAEVLRLAADAAQLVGASGEAFELAGAAVAALPAGAAPARRVACGVLLARCAFNAGDDELALATIAELEEALGEAPAPADEAEVVAIHARLMMASGRAAESARRCEDALALARRAGTRLVEGHMLATLGPNLAELGDTDGAIEAGRESVVIAEQVGDPDLIIRAYNNFTDVLFSTGHLGEAAALAVDAIDDGGALPVIRLGGAGFNSTEALIVLGRWDEAGRLAAMMEGKASAACTSDSLNSALLAVRRGDLDVGEIELDRRCGTTAQAVAHRHFVLAEIALERGRPDDAAAEIDCALSVLVGVDLSIEVLTAHALGLRALADQAAEPVRPGRRAAVDPAKFARRAESMLAEVEAWVSEHTDGAAPASPWVVALLAQCRAEAARVTGGDAGAWVRAAEAWDALGARFHVASCRYREAEALLAGRDDRRRAAAALADAWRAARDLGAACLVARCERLGERARITLDDPGAGNSPQQRAGADLGLTAREVEVLDLLARGRTDGQIAEELFISKKTASVHVSNILRKLDARDRWHAGDLGRAAGLGA